MIHIETIGSRIKTIRKLNKINQVDFSNRIGISQATLSELEQDKYRPSVDTLLSIVEEFGTDVEWLLIGAKDSVVKAFDVAGVNEKEADLLMLFGKLKISDQDEIIEFIKLKISRY
ncbi:MAG: transcriptional regulator [Paenibacillus sp.]|nr:transcriptional regulator [Paenibacillus sp.]